MRTKLVTWLRSSREGDDGALDGQSMVEYSLVIVLTTVVCIAVVTLLGVNVKQYLYDVIELVISGALTI